jgi:hypothetical protein
MRTERKKVSVRKLTSEFHVLHREIRALTEGAVPHAIRCGEILFELKVRVGHGGWRTWIQRNLGVSMREAQRFMRCYLHRSKLDGCGSLREAMDRLASKEQRTDAASADLRHIEKGLVGPIRVVRRRLLNLTYRGESPELVERIIENLRSEVETLLEEIKHWEAR